MAHGRGGAAEVVDAEHVDAEHVDAEHVDAEHVDAEHVDIGPPTVRGAEPSTDLTGQLLDDRYQMIKRVGQGGMCVVYLAHDTRLGDLVAVKILLPALIDDPISMARLRREATLGAKLAHPNICHIIRIGATDAGFDYIVMPFVEGELLCERIARQGQLPLPVTAGFVRDVCAGLQVAHDLGILHRDLKPENIMIVTRPPDGSEQAVVIDFSLANGPEVPALTVPGKIVGTPEFMSPEQLRGERLDARSDVYSLAFTAYEMLTGQLPFEGRTAHEIMVARLKGDAIPIRVKRPDLDIPAAVDAVIKRALAHHANDRYPTALAFGEAFSRAAATSDAERRRDGTLLSRLWRRGGRD
jgi:serine/threonine protein kinase